MADTITRAVTLSIAPGPGLDWPTLWSLLHPSWDAVQRAANEAVRAYLTGDPAEIELTAKGKRGLAAIPKEAANAAYHKACAAAPELPTTVVSDICQRVRARYLKDRWAVRVSGRQSTPSFRRPLPLSVRKQSWSLEARRDTEADRDVYWTQIPLLDRRGKRRPVIEFVVRTARDAALLKRIASGEWPHATLEIQPPGWRRQGAPRAKIVYTRPRPEAVARDKSLLLCTPGRDHLLSARVEGGDAANDPFHWNADWLRETIIAYERRRRRMAEDCKHEIRTPAARRRRHRRDLGVMAEKHHHRVRTALQQIAAQVAGRARRQRCGAVIYDDSLKTWVEPFPWDQLRQMIAQRCEKDGVAFETAQTNGRCSADMAGGSPSARTAADKPCSGSPERKGRGM